MNSHLIFDQSPHNDVISDSELGQDQKAMETKDITESLGEFWNHEAQELPEIVHDNIKTPDEYSQPDDCHEAHKDEQFKIQFSRTRYEPPS